MEKFNRYGIITKDFQLDIEALTDSQKFKLINIFYYSYYNTNQDIDVFSVEFFETIGKIRLNRIPLKLKHLNVNEIYEDIEKILRCI